MKRRKFLAFLPTLSAIPFVGKEIVQNESGINIIKPTPIIHPGESKGFDPFKVEVRIYQEGQHIANAYLTEFNIENGFTEYEATDGSIQTYPLGGQRITFTGVVDGALVFNRDKLKL